MSGAAATVDVRDLGLADLDDVVRIDALHTDTPKRDWWVGVFDDFLAGRRRRERIGLAAHRDGRLVGFLLGEVRAFEFGSEVCGWVFALGVQPEAGRDRVGSTLLAEALRRFRALGIETVRTMVRRNDVPVTAFFRSNGFVGGSFVQLELDLGEEP
jgi:ribosomal protein S18 acetylase RimI-like enzyme